LKGCSGKDQDERPAPGNAGLRRFGSGLASLVPQFSSSRDADRADKQPEGRRYFRHLPQK
jgi:hypothetical protein